MNMIYLNFQTRKKWIFIPSPHKLNFKTLIGRYLYNHNKTRVRGITRRASALRSEGDGFEARPEPRNS